MSENIQICSQFLWEPSEKLAVLSKRKKITWKAAVGLQCVFSSRYPYDPKNQEGALEHERGRWVLTFVLRERIGTHVVGYSCYHFQHEYMSLRKPASAIECWSITSAINSLPQSPHEMTLPLSHFKYPELERKSTESIKLAIPVPSYNVPWANTSFVSVSSDKCH